MLVSEYLCVILKKRDNGIAVTKHLISATCYPDLPLLVHHLPHVIVVRVGPDKQIPISHVWFQSMGMGQGFPGIWLEFPSNWEHVLISSAGNLFHTFLVGGALEHRVLCLALCV